MSAAALPIPGALWGPYPERRDGRRRAALRWPSTSRYARFARQVQSNDFSSLGDGAMSSTISELRQRLARSGLTEEAMAPALALLSQVALRALGVRPHFVQLFAARVMLDERLAEMATGEGKTLAAALTAACAALARVPVHVVTVNDYLARRDAAQLGPLYARLGLSVGAVTEDLAVEARRAAYGCDITYCTAKQLVFDYLRDAVARGESAGTLREQISDAGRPPTLLRGLCMAIIDEADSVLIDEAVMPFILSRARGQQGREPYGHALALAAKLQPGRHYRLDVERAAAELSEAGRHAVAGTQVADPLWAVARYREELVTLALCALHHYRRDRDYLVRAGRVELIDATTGRAAAGRAWSRGLHQLIELKEGCRPSPVFEIASETTYQRFFSRYLRLCGMSGTLSEGRAELKTFYGLRVTRVPLRSPSRRTVLPTRVFTAPEERWTFVVQRAREVQAAGRAVLIGTDSVADSQTLCDALRAAGLEHAVLNARHDRDEAGLVAQAGAPGRITVATSMAGRGTDIVLDPAVAARGGLHVILCQANASARVDLQFLGRCARRGEPGSCETLHVLATCLPRWLALFLVRRRLRRELQRQRQLRRELWRRDQALQQQPILGARSQ